MEVVHLGKLLPIKAQQNGTDTAMRYRDYKVSQWKNISWERLNQESSLTAAALLSNGIANNDRIGIFSQNKPECIIAETAAYSIRCAVVPMYATSTTAQIEYIIKDAAIQLIFVGEQYQYDRAFEALQSDCGLKQIVIFDTEVRLHRNDHSSVYFSDFEHNGLISGKQAEVENHRKDCSFDDIANILYTSGTSGHPKGVIVLHSNFQEIIRVMYLKLRKVIGKHDSSLSFLPMTHIFEKAWSYYCFENDIRVDVNLKPADVQMAIKETRPNAMCSVPRFWEKVYAGVQEVLAGYSPFMQRVLRFALKIGKRYHIDYRRLNKRVPPLCFLTYNLFNLIVFSKIRRTVGLENGLIFPTAGAKLSDEICVFMRSIGVPLYYGYGLTESTATVSCFDKKMYEIGTVGSLIDGLQVRIDENGEVLLKGKTITPGYYNNPQANQESFTPDGFFRTGDSGYFDQNGHLVLTDRIKDLFKTSNGKYIAPQNIETVLANDRYIDLAVVIGDQRKFVSALIIPVYSELPKILKELAISDLNADDLLACLNDKRVYNFFDQRIRALQKDMAGFEQIRRFALLPEPFSMANGELTDTLKVKRKVVNEHYRELIDKLYE